MIFGLESKELKTDQKVHYKVDVHLNMNLEIKGLAKELLIFYAACTKSSEQ